MTARKREIIDRVWALVETSIDGYSRLIDSLLNVCSEEKIQEVLKTLVTPGECVRCGSDLLEGRCSDETCPFSDCDQDNPKGWEGHPEKKPHINDE